MEVAHAYLDRWSPRWQQLCHRLAPRCANPDCVRATPWRRIRARSRGVRVQGSWYCADDCLRYALTAALRRLVPPAERSVLPHRIPLGLLLLSRQQLAAEQLQMALAAQRNAGHGKIGEWVQNLGFASEWQVTAALARQWSCPLLPARLVPAAPLARPQIPATLLKSFVMIPVRLVEPLSVLHVAFGGGVDYTVLYAMEQITGCRTEACITARSAIARALQALPDHRGDAELVFAPLEDHSDIARIIGNYCERLSAYEIRMAWCRGNLWARLLRIRNHPVDLLFAS